MICNDFWNHWMNEWMIFVYVCMVCRRRSLFFVKMWKFPTIVNRIWLLFFPVFEFPIFFSHCFADGTDWFDTFFSHCISKIFFCWFYLSPDYICMKCVIWFENRKSFHSLSFFFVFVFVVHSVMFIYGGIFRFWKFWKIETRWNKIRSWLWSKSSFISQFWWKNSSDFRLFVCLFVDVIWNQNINE